jgi:CelD/BcsL family acetyltransferase involved in cellulose biosynthesis
MKRSSQRPAEFEARVLSGIDDPFFMLAESLRRSAFQTRQFVDAIARHVVDRASTLIIVGVTDAQSAPVALVTFVSRRRFGLPVIEALDFGLSDYFAPILLGPAPLTSAQSDLLWRAVLRVLPGAHAVAFKKLPRLIYGASHALSGASFLKPMGACATTLRLQGTDRNEAFSLDRMSVARDVRRKTRKLEQIGKLSLTEAKTQSEVDSFLDALVTFRRPRFAELGRSDALLDDRVVAFYRDLASPGDGPAIGRLFALRVGAEVVAVLYGFCLDGVFTLIAISISADKGLQAGSPGLVALYKTLEWCVGQGYQVFDLSVGSMHYKTRFDAEEVELFEYQRALTPLGWIIVAEAALRRRVRHLVLKAPHLRRHFERVDVLFARLRAVRP